VIRSHASCCRWHVEMHRRCNTLVIHLQCRTRCITLYLKVRKYMIYQSTFSFTFLTVCCLFKCIRRAQCCVCLKPERKYVVFFLVLSDFMWEMIACFVDIDDIVDHHCLSFLLTIITLFDWQHIHYVWCTCFATDCRHTYGYKLRSSSRQIVP